MIFELHCRTCVKKNVPVDESRIDSSCLEKTARQLEREGLKRYPEGHIFHVGCFVAGSDCPICSEIHSEWVRTACDSASRELSKPLPRASGGDDAEERKKKEEMEDEIDDSLDVVTQSVSVLTCEDIAKTDASSKTASAFYCPIKLSRSYKKKEKATPSAKRKRGASGTDVQGTEQGDEDASSSMDVDPHNS